MTPIKELGECVIGTGDREFFFPAVVSQHGANR